MLGAAIVHLERGCKASAWEQSWHEPSDAITVSRHPELRVKLNPKFKTASSAFARYQCVLTRAHHVEALTRSSDKNTTHTRTHARTGVADPSLTAMARLLLSGIMYILYGQVKPIYMHGPLSVTTVYSHANIGNDN